jgi:hypothetical protein
MESVLTWLMPLLSDEGAFLSDEVPAAAIVDGRIRPDASTVPGAIREYFGSRGIGCSCRNLSLGVSVIVPRGAGEPFLRLERLEQLLLQNTVVRSELPLTA